MADNKQIQNLKAKIKSLEGENLAKDNEIKALKERLENKEPEIKSLEGENLNTYKVKDSFKTANYCIDGKNILLLSGLPISNETYNKFSKDFQSKVFTEI